MKYKNLKKAFTFVIVTLLSFPKVSDSTINQLKPPNAGSISSTPAVVGGILVRGGAVCRFGLTPKNTPPFVHINPETTPMVPGLPECGVDELALVENISNRATAGNPQVALLGGVFFVGVACVLSGILGAAYGINSGYFQQPATPNGIIAEFKEDFTRAYMEYINNPFVYGLTGYTFYNFLEYPILWTQGLVGIAIGLVCGIGASEAAEAIVLYYYPKD
ncbi:MAG: hypothetical protein K1X29_00375 [Bdellovibrionales bacterium]|nr:hypothetical protein [Bdellovibrionales bacterium]